MIYIIITESILTDAIGSLANDEFCFSRHCTQVMISGLANIQQSIWLAIVPRSTHKSGITPCSIISSAYNLYIVRYLNVH